MRVCRRCGSEQARSRWCSSCAVIVRAESEALRKARAKIPCSSCGKPSKAGACMVHKPRAMAHCPHCGAEFWPWRGGKHPVKFCSRTCATTATALARTKPPKPPRLCRWCGAAVLRKWSPYCSIQHQRKAHNQAHHVRRRGLRGTDPIAIEDIYFRDHGRCGLCGKPVPPRFGWKISFPKAPTLDHIVPISKGGQHVRSNVQLAHLGCNSAKGNRPGCNSQLRIM